MRKLIKTCGILLVTSTLLTSCVTIFRGKKPHKSVSIESIPSTANVKINGEVIGQTPLNYELKNRKSKLVQISKEGFEEYNTKIESKLSPAINAYVRKGLNQDNINNVFLNAMGDVYIPRGKRTKVYLPRYRKIFVLA